MKLIDALVLAAPVVLFIFAALNWTALTAPTVLSFVFFRVGAPLGVILLGTRRHAQEVRALRELADNAEASRLAELRRQLDDTATLGVALLCGIGFAA